MMAPHASASKAQPANPLAAFTTLGQAVWLDFLSRSFIAEGESEEAR